MSEDGPGMDAPERRGVESIDERRRAERMDAVVQDLLSGRPLRLRADDEQDREAIEAAARLAAAREG
ncbi:MAG: hypothetical protein ACREPA_12020, partial [Candidatus Dormibacteraceae bacterium]